MLDTVYASDWQKYIYKERERERDVFPYKYQCFSFFPGTSHGMEDKNRQEPKDEELEKQVLATRPAPPGFVAKKNR
jgi:hypothetical protein